MGIGISEAAAALWLAYDEDSYYENYIEDLDEEGYKFFIELPDWAYSETDGPFYIDGNGAIWSISLRPSQKGELIGNLI